MISAEIIAIGTELLLGDNLDTNTAFIARQFREIGINLYRTSIVGDNEQRIAEMIQESLARAQIIITTGGLGPTVDDPTRGAVAHAIGRELEFREPLWTAIQARFALFNRTASENNRTQAFVPQECFSIENPVGTAPAFIVEIDDKMIASLPGVPGEMELILKESIIPFISKKYEIRSIIKSCILHCSGIGESMVDEKISDLEKSENPTVGLLAHPGLVDIRITARAEDSPAADQMINPIRQSIRDRLGDNIYGEDSQTLSSVLTDQFKKLNCTLQVFTSNVNEEFLHKLIPADLRPWLQFSVISDEKVDKENQALFNSLVGKLLDPCLGIFQYEGEFRSELTLFWSWNSRQSNITRYYAGPQGSLTTWRRNTILDFIRRNLG
jgi:nicotinamide-nucleotide amidase